MDTLSNGLVVIIHSVGSNFTSPLELSTKLALSDAYKGQLEHIVFLLAIGYK